MLCVEEDGEIALEMRIDEAKCCIITKKYDENETRSHSNYSDDECNACLDIPITLGCIGEKHEDQILSIKKQTDYIAQDSFVVHSTVNRNSYSGNSDRRYLNRNDSQLDSIKTVILLI